jgi:prephenate dehydrogenase
VVINRLAIVGVGLIGGSLARALRRAGWCREIVGSGRQIEPLRLAVELGVIDRFDLDIQAAVAGADVVVVATPLAVMQTVFDQVRRGAPDAVVTDVGSVKQSVIRAAQQVYGEEPARLVPGHPIAGTEHSGVAASFAALFEGKRVILTPLACTQAVALQTVTGMWQQTGAVVEQLNAARHDELLAATSHLPHVLAYALMNCLHELDGTGRVFQYAGSSFRDVTRIAASDPALWRDIWHANRDVLLQMIDRYEVTLAVLRRAIRDNDSDKALEMLTRGQWLRERNFNSMDRTLGAPED